MSISQMTPINTELERLSDVTKLSAHVTRILGQNPGLMTLQGTNSYLLQPPSNNLAPLILIDTSSPHTAQQYVDLVMTHLFHLGLESGTRETHFESPYAKSGLKYVPEEKQEEVKAKIAGMRKDDPLVQELMKTEYGPNGRWTDSAKKDRRLPAIEHIILTHRHLDHVGALALLLTTLKENGLPPPKIWKFPSPDEDELALSERDRQTTDMSLITALPQGTYQSFSPFQPLHPVMPGLMISIIDPVYKHLLKHDKDGKPKWNEVPEIARVSIRCLRTPGHTADSISLVMCEGEKGVFTGDTVLGQGTTIFTDLSAYMISLKTLLALKPAVLYPAHGPHIPTREDCARHLSIYLSHRQEREDQIVSLLEKLAADPDLLGKKMAEWLKKVEDDKAALNKYNHEFLSGKPYVPKVKKEEEKPKKDGEPSGEAETAEGEKKDVKEKQSDKKDSSITEVNVEDKFPSTERGITIPLICRLLYQTDKEGIIFAASKSIEAHLKKLEGEGKVRKVTVNLPKVVEGSIGDPESQSGWEWAGEEVRSALVQEPAAEVKEG